MSVANAHAMLSKASRKRVGACLVTKTGVIIPGYNGTAVGASNECEDVLEDGTLITKPTVIHAELNSILKAAKEGVSVVDSILYVSLSPCIPCSAMIIQAGVKEVVYSEMYRDVEGIEHLVSNDVLVRQFE